MLYFHEESHTYILYNKVLKSVSAIVASQFRKFNARAVSGYLAKHKACNEDSPYYGMTQDDILRQWSESGNDSRDAGTRLHRDIEMFYKEGTLPAYQELPEWKQFMAFLSDHKDWLCIANEYQVHNDNVAGTIDAIFDTPEGIVIVDWKRSKAIDYSGYGMGKGMMKHVPDCNYSKYSLQLSLYRQLCHLEVANCYIIQMHPSLETYQKIRAQNFHVEAKALLS